MEAAGFAGRRDYGVRCNAVVSAEEGVSRKAGGGQLGWKEAFFRTLGGTKVKGWGRGCCCRCHQIGTKDRVGVSKASVSRCRRERLKGQVCLGLMNGERWRDGGRGRTFKGGAPVRVWRRLVGGRLTPAAAAGRTGGVVVGWGANVVCSGQDLELKLNWQDLRARVWGGQRGTGERDCAMAAIPA